MNTTSLLRAVLGAAMLTLLVAILARRVFYGIAIDPFATGIVVLFLGYGMGATPWPDVALVLRRFLGNGKNGEGG